MNFVETSPSPLINTHGKFENSEHGKSSGKPRAVTTSYPDNSTSVVASTFSYICITSEFRNTNFQVMKRDSTSEIPDTSSTMQLPSVPRS